MLRAVLTEEAHVKATFDDNTVVVLEPSGAAFTVFAPSNPSRTHGGEYRNVEATSCSARGAPAPHPVRQLCEFATSKYASKVAQTLALRNTYIDEPYFCSLLLLPEVGMETFRTRYTLPTVHWSRSVQDAEASQLLIQADDGSLTVKCIEEVVRVVLAPHRQQLSLTFPLLVKVLDGPVPFYEHVWQSQVYATADCPARWAPALDLLLCAAAAQDGEAGDRSAPAPTATDATQARGFQAGGLEAASEAASEVVCAETGQGLGAGREGDERRGRAGVRSSALPTCTERVTAVWENLDPTSWWALHTLSYYPADAHVRVEWTPEGVLWMLPSHEVLGVLTRNGDALLSETGGRYFRHLSATLPVQEKAFSTHAVPDWSGCLFTGLAKRAAALHAAAHTTRVRLDEQLVLERRAAAAAGTVSTAPMSAEVVEEEVQAGTGVFTAYADGRVRVRFEDRTQLELDAAGATAHAVLSSGGTVTVRTAMPLGVEEYVAAAMQFHAWARMGTLARATYLAQTAGAQRRVRDELSRVERWRYICQGGDAPLPGASDTVEYQPATLQWQEPATTVVSQAEPHAQSANLTNAVTEMLERNAAMQKALLASLHEDSVRRLADRALGYEHGGGQAPQHAYS